MVPRGEFLYLTNSILSAWHRGLPADIIIIRTWRQCCWLASIDQPFEFLRHFWTPMPRAWWIWHAPKRSVVTLIYPATSEILNMMINYSAWRKGPLAPKAYAAKGAYLLLPDVSELEIANERNGVTEISVSNLVVRWKEKRHKSRQNLKAIIISCVYISLLSHCILLQQSNWNS